MLNDKEIKNYIKDSLSQGNTKEEIFKELIDDGLSIEQIQKGFEALKLSKDKEDTQKRTIQIIVTIGAILIGAGIFSFIASNWQEITKSIKVLLIIFSMLATYTVGWYLREERGFIRTGNALIFLGSIIYGAGIFLLAQMFNVRVDWPDGFIIWMIGVIVLALAIDLVYLFYFAFALGIISLAGQYISPLLSIINIIDFDYRSFTSPYLLATSTLLVFLTGLNIRKRVPIDDETAIEIKKNKWNFVLALILIFFLGPVGLLLYFSVLFVRKTGEQSIEETLSETFLLLSLFFLFTTFITFNTNFGSPLSWKTILLITTLIGIFGAYFYRLIYTLIFSLVSGVGWWGFQSFDWVKAENIMKSSIFAGILLIMLLFYILGWLHSKSKLKKFSSGYVLIGMIPISATLFLLSTQYGLIALNYLNKGVTFDVSWKLTTSYIVVGFSLVISTLYALKNKFIFTVEAITTITIAALFCWLLLFPPGKLFFDSDSFLGLMGFLTEKSLTETGIYVVAALNISIFFYLVVMIFSGYLRKEEWIINLGALLLFLLIIFKYFDWFFAFINKGVFFVISGLLFLAVGWFMERGRRYMISNINE